MASAEDLPVVVWDVDDVMAQTIDPLLHSANTRFGLHLTRVLFTENFVEMIGHPREVITDWFLQFCHKEFPRLEPTFGMPEVLSSLRGVVTHAQLTSRRAMFRAITEAWTMTHYGAGIGLNMMETDWDNNPLAHLITKAQRFATIAGAACMVDNDKKHPLAVAAAGNWGICLPHDLSGPMPSDTPPKFRVARHPDEVHELITTVVLPDVLRDAA